MSTAQKQLQLTAIEEPETIKFFVTVNQSFPHIQCQYSFSKNILKTIGSSHISIYPDIKGNYFKVKQEGTKILLISRDVYEEQAQPLDQLQLTKACY